MRRDPLDLANLGQQRFQPLDRGAGLLEPTSARRRGVIARSSSSWDSNGTGGFSRYNALPARST